MKIELGGLDHPQVINLLQQHLADMHKTSPKESVHALDLSGLKAPEIEFYSVWSGNQIAGCGAIKYHDKVLAEIKSMRTSEAFRGLGVASTLLAFLLEQAMSKGLQQVKLETGTQSYFHAAHQLYQKFGFIDCPPFADYRLDPNSRYLSLSLPN
ncbi:GNAT family N-acetyltransferase [Pleionea litopenaei]|uniref:GNAT family N-acetyltransferase n=1 Tax=Pleionea litopenaei TaxID=3070815 RepID=A0AA51RVR2_9GAMM|nr:GNAT family N-acetyltransferase [Pleionea sp. HL-JVS1]WMS88455.1 GNAT family N-acetyltransferase [Pleionea sp. HL-JVS1]